MSAGRRLLPLALAGLALALACGLIAGWLPAGWGVRVAVAVLLIGIGGSLARRSGTRLLLASPLAILAASALVGYSLMPALAWESGIGSHSTYLIEFSHYLHGRGESLVLAFSAAALGLLALLACLPEPSHMEEDHPTPRFVSLLPYPLLAAWLTLGWSAKRGFGPLSGSLGSELRLILPALFCATVALTLCGPRWGKGRSGRGPLPSLLAIAVMLTVGLAKIAIFQAVALGWARLLLVPIRLGRLISLVSAMAVLIVFALGTMEYWRGNLSVANFGRAGGPEWVTLARHIPINAVGKLGFRQLESGYCLDRLVAVHWDNPGMRSPVYFLEALVPRAIWPEKPSISNGHEYGVRYCAAKDFPTLSNSVTLLGEPLAEAGRTGLVVAMAGLAAALTAFSVFAHRRFFGLVMTVALAPWLLDFDQHFAMYVANLAKVALIQMPVWVIYFMLIRRREASPCVV